MASTQFDRTLDACLAKLRRQLDELKAVFPRFPHAVVDGAWTTSGGDEWDSLTDGYWTGGFWIGMLFLAEKLTGDPEFGAWARKWMDALAPRAKTEGMHDLGFVFFPSAALGYELTGDEKLLDIATEAAANVAACYSSLYRAIPIFNRRPPMDRIIAIDTMMNLPLLWWAANRTDNDMMRRVARNHADTTIELLLRENGATFHIIKFDTTERKAEETASWQGRAPDSCWSRGQAWAVAGFAYACLFTGDPGYRAALDRALSFFSAHLPPDGIPYWDLLVECKSKYEWEKEKRDSSALAAATHALLLLNDNSLTRSAEKWLDSLIGNCLAGENEPGFLKHVCFHRPANIATDVSCVFADFFFLLSLAAASGRLSFYDQGHLY